MAVSGSSRRRYRVGAAGRGGPAGGASALAAALVLALTVGPARAEDRNASAITVQSPFFGDVLYEFYQGHYAAALTGLNVSKQFGRLKPHEQEAELLRGGLLLSNGLQAEAGEVFTRLTATGNDAAVRRRAWFFLAKLRYQKGLIPEAAAALERIEGNLPEAQEDARALLQSQVYLALNRYDKASDSLRVLASRKVGTRAADQPSDGFFGRMLAMVGWGSTPAPSEGWGELDPEMAGRYARYNLGVALMRSGDREGGARWLDELGQAPTYSEEGRSLRDQANVTLGFSLLQAQQPEQAKVHLERVRLNGPLSTKALLGFGWAAMALKQPKEALVPWSELAGRASDDAAVLEARLALPYALAELGETGPALLQYEEAVKQFEVETARIQTSIDSLRTGDWLRLALGQSGNGELGVTALAPQLPSMPYSGHLNSVMAQNAFHEGLKDYRDLKVVQDNLTLWQGRMKEQADTAALRKAEFAQHLSALQVALADARGKSAEALRQRLATVLQARAVDAERAAAMDARTGAAQARLATLSAEVEALRTERQKYLQDLAVASLTQQQQRLVGYTTQARFALAQLYDRAYKENSNQGAARATSP